MSAMSVDVDTRSRAQSFRRGVRRFLGTNGPQRSSNAAELVSSVTAAPMQAMFQDARNTNIRHATFNIFGPGASTATTSSSDSTSGLLIPVTSVPTDLMDLSADSVLPADPMPTPLTSPEIYAHHLITKNRGYPLWIPSPNKRLPACYRASGVRIGDVGIITPEGAFSFLFNVFHEATHPINGSMHLPIDFVPFVRASETNPCHIDEFTESSAGSYLADESMVRMDEGNDRLRTVLKTSAAHAAVLMMPEPVYAFKLQSTALLQKYVYKYIKSWYRFARTVLGLEMNNGDLRVVYGCRKSAAFGLATISNSTHRSWSGASEASSTELTFSIDDSWTEVTRCKYGWHHRGSAEWKVGPSLDENRDIQQDMTDASNLQPDHIMNQCLFVSTIDFTLPEHEWQLLICDDLVSVTTSHWCPNTQSPSSASTQSASPGGRPSNFSHSSLSGSVPGEGSHPVSPQNRCDCDTHGKVEFWPSTPKKPFNPSDILAQFLLRVVPQATAVALCSDDWGPFMTGSVQTVAALIHDILSANDICYDDGMVYLSAKSRAADHSNLTVPFGVIRFLLENGWQHTPNSLGPNGDQTWRALAQAVHGVVNPETRLVQEQSVQREMTLTKTPSPNARPARITIKLSDLMTNADEFLPLASLIQVMLDISLLWGFRITSPKRRDGPHAVYNESLESSSGLANNVRELIEKAHIREERRALRQQDIARVPSGSVSDCNFKKIAERLNIEAEYGLGAESNLDRMPPAPMSPPLSEPNQTPVNLPIAEPWRTAPPRRTNIEYPQKREQGQKNEPSSISSPMTLGAGDNSSLVEYSRSGHSEQKAHSDGYWGQSEPQRGYSELGLIVHHPQGLPLSLPKTDLRPRRIHKRPLDIGANEWKTANTAPRPRKIPKRLDNGANESDFYGTFGKQQKSVFTSPPPPTDTPAQDQQTGSSHRSYDPQELAQPFGFPVVQQLGQAAHTVQYPGQTVGTYPVYGYYNVQPGHAAPIPNDTMTTGEATSPGYSHFPAADNQYAGDPMVAPLIHIDPGAFATSMSHMHTQGLPTRGQCNQASITFPHGVGSTGYGQHTGPQQGITSGDQTLDHYLPYMQQNIENRSNSQFPSMSGASHHADSSDAGGCRYLPPSSSLGGRPGGAQ